MKNRLANTFLIPAISATLVVGSVLALVMPYSGNTARHTLLEVVATLIAVFVGLVALTHYRTDQKGIFLYLGAGFLGAGLLDGYHGLVSSTAFGELMPSPQATLAPWSWNASRLFLSVLLVLAYSAAIREQEDGGRRSPPRRVVLVVATMTLATFALFGLTPLPPAYHPDGILGRPEEFLSAVGFTIAFVGFYRRGEWRRNSFECLLLISLLVNGAAQLVYMPFSRSLFDAPFDAAHMLKIAAYAALFAGLLESMRVRFEYAEAAAQGNQARLRAILDNTTAIAHVKDRDGRYRMINTEFKRLFEVSDRDVIGKTDTEIFAPVLAEAFRANDEYVITHEESIDVEEIIPHADGARIYRSSRFPIRNQHGELTSVGGLATDVTDLKHAHRRFERVVEVAPAAMVLVDTAGLVTLVNTRVEEYFGYERRELIGLPVETLIPTAAQLCKVEQQIANTPPSDVHSVPQTIDLLARRKNGSEFPVEIGFAPLGTETGPQVLMAVLDITQRKEYEEALERSNEDLQQFAYVASHDLQEPLRMISSYVQLLERRYADRLDQDASEFIAYAVNGAKRMQRLINDLLTYARVETKARPPTPTDSVELLNECIENLRSTISETGAIITVDAPLPLLAVDRSQIVQLLQNLLGNAIKFGGKPPTVHVGATSRGAEWVFSVRDNGIGIEPQYRDRIFVIFQRLHGPTEYTGTGIGLAVCKKIVERHGGHIWFESEPQEGTTFYFSLPQTTAASPVPKPSEAECTFV